ncbi:hypothetical protein LXL04_001860 [Taraxacum kok-saghyz]
MDCYFVRERVESEEILPMPIASKDQVADIFTKSLDAQQLQDFLGKCEPVEDVNPLNQMKTVSSSWRTRLPRNPAIVRTAAYSHFAASTLGSSPVRTSKLSPLRDFQGKFHHTGGFYEGFTRRRNRTWNLHPKWVSKPGTSSQLGWKSTTANEPVALPDFVCNLQDSNKCAEHMLIIIVEGCIV